MGIRRIVTLLLAMSLVAAACSDDTTEGGDATTTTTTSTTTTTTTTTTSTTTTTLPLINASAGCGAGAAASSELLTIDTTDGLTREYHRHVPAGYDDATAVPLVLNFHGLTSNIESQRALSRLEPLADEETFVVVTPQGTLRDGEVPFWNSGGARPDGVDDVQFTHELLDRLEADLCLDVDRVYSTGMSNGGFMSGRLACAMPERITAIAGVTGLTGSNGCDTPRAVPVLMFHGTADAVVSYDFIPGVVEQWSGSNGCEAEPAISAVSDEVEHRVYACPDDGQVEFYVVDGGGHTWPGSPLPEPLATILGYTTEDIDATAIMWEFFQRHAIS